MDVDFVFDIFAVRLGIVTVEKGMCMKAEIVEELLPMKAEVVEGLLRGKDPVDLSAEMREAMRIMQEDKVVSEAVEIVERRMGVDDLGSLLTHVEVDACGSRNTAAELNKYKAAWERLRARIAQEAERGTAVYVRDVCSDILREMDGEIPGKVAV